MSTFDRAALVLFAAVVLVLGFLTVAFALDLAGAWDYPVQGETCPYVDTYDRIEDCP